MSLITLQDITISFGGPLVLDKVDLRIQQGERVCLLGRNGTGKTTLLKLINGDLEPDNGTIARQQGTSTALLTQEVPEGIKGTAARLMSVTRVTASRYAGGRGGYDAAGKNGANSVK